MPDLLWHILERLLKARRLVLLLDADGRDVIDSADEDTFNPVFVLAITNKFVSKVEGGLNVRDKLTFLHKPLDLPVWNLQSRSSFCLGAMC